MFDCYENFENFVSERLAALRIQKKISARDMSLTIGQGKGYINSIENGKSMPSMQGFFYICEFFNISPKDFFDNLVAYPERTNKLIIDLNALNDEQLAIVESVVKGLKK